MKNIIAYFMKPRKQMNPPQSVASGAGQATHSRAAYQVHTNESRDHLLEILEIFHSNEKKIDIATKPF